jgi:hypothetical protein
MLTVAIPACLGAEKLGETITLRRKAHGARRLNVALASGPQSSNVREFIGKIQKK